MNLTIIDERRGLAGADAEAARPVYPSFARSIDPVDAAIRDAVLERGCGGEVSVILPGHARPPLVLIVGTVEKRFRCKLQSVWDWEGGRPRTDGKVEVRYWSTQILPPPDDDAPF